MDPVSSPAHVKTQGARQTAGSSPPLEPLPDLSARSQDRARATGRRTAIAAPHRTPITRLLDAPEVGALVPRLPAETLHALVDQAGLHACGDLIAAATPAQLISVLDLDLWPGGRPGQDEHFDAHRFGEWLEVLAETGASVSARIVAALDEDLVVSGLSRHIRVFDPAALANARVDRRRRPPDDPATTPHDGPECELGGYLVRGTGSAPWDAIVAVCSCARRRVSRLLPRCHARVPAAVQFHTGSRRPRRASDRSAAADPRCRRHEGAPQIRARIQYACRRARLSPHGQAPDGRGPREVQQSDRGGVLSCRRGRRGGRRTLRGPRPPTHTLST